jgi:hypothetical protein
VTCVPAIAIPSFAKPLDDPWGLGLGAHGPTVIPAYSSFDSSREMIPYNPGDYARYLPIDLDANNSYGISEWEKRTGRTHPGLGFGVCRHGFGLLNLPKMTRDEAERVAIELNDITADALPAPTRDRHAA